MSPGASPGRGGSAALDTTVRSRDLAAELARALGRDEAEARRILDRVIDVIRDHLVRGEQVLLKDFATIKVVEEKAQIVKDPETGHQYIKPVGKKVAFSPVDGFREEIERTRLASIILAVPQDDPFARVIEFHFSRVGWKVHIVSDVDRCVKMVRETGAHLVIVDDVLSDAGRLVEAIKTTRALARVPVVGLFPGGTDPDRGDDFRVVPDEFLVEPFEVYHLLTLAESELARSGEEEVIFDQQIVFRFSTREKHLEKANQIGIRLFRASGLSEEGQIALAAAFREAIGNAAQHGNRDDVSRMIRVVYLLDKEKITIVVNDEGKGFDHHRYTLRGETRDAISAARERHDQGRVGGLGIMLMLKCTDRLEYNDSGNAVTLTKQRTA